jgi:hypothetical protein
MRVLVASALVCASSCRLGILESVARARFQVGEDVFARHRFELADIPRIQF